MEGEWLPPPMGWDGGLAVFANICTWAAPARQGLTWKQPSAPASPISLVLGGGDGPAESGASLHPAFPLAVAWLRDGAGAASSRSTSTPPFCDLGQAP